MAKSRVVPRRIGGRIETRGVGGGGRGRELGLSLFVNNNVIISNELLLT